MPQYYGGSIPWISSADINSGVIQEAREYLTEEAIKKTSVNKVSAGTVLLVTRTGVGKVAIAQQELCFSQDITAVIPKDSDLEARYLAWFLRGCQGSLISLSRGATIKGVPRAVIEDLEIPMFPLGAQKRIAAILDKADALRAKRRKALDQLDALAQAIFIEMFGADECPFFELGEALEFITSGGRGWAKYYSEQGARFIRSYDVQMNHISDAEPIYVAAPDNAEARRTIVRQGDVLLTITGSKIGRVSPVSKKFDGAYVSQHVAILRGDACRIDSDFLSYYLSLPAGGQRQIEKSQYGQTKPGLNFEQIKKFRVPDVSIEIQREFTRRLKAIEELRQAQTRHLVASESLFSSLQHRAFRGEL